MFYLYDILQVILLYLGNSIRPSTIVPSSPLTWNMFSIRKESAIRILLANLLLVITSDFLIMEEEWNIASHSHSLFSFSLSSLTSSFSSKFLVFSNNSSNCWSSSFIPQRWSWCWDWWLWVSDFTYSGYFCVVCIWFYIHEVLKLDWNCANSENYNNNAMICSCCFCFACSHCSFDCLLPLRNRLLLGSDWCMQ